MYTYSDRRSFVISKRLCWGCLKWGHLNNVCLSIYLSIYLDEQSDACFVKATVAKALKLEGTEINLKLSTMLGEENITCERISGLVMRGVNSGDQIPIPKTYIRDMIPAQRSQIPDPDSAKLWPHLQQISNEIMKPIDDVEIGLVIGINCPRAIKPREVIPGKDDDPYAI